LNEKSTGSRSRKQRLTTVGTRCADHVTPLYPQKLALTSPTGGDRSVGIVRVRIKAMEFSLVFFYCVTELTSLGHRPSEKPTIIRPTGILRLLCNPRPTVIYCFIH